MELLRLLFPLAQQLLHPILQQHVALPSTLVLIRADAFYMAVVFTAEGCNHGMEVGGMPCLLLATLLPEGAAGFREGHTLLRCLRRSLRYPLRILIHMQLFFQLLNSILVIGQLEDLMVRELQLPLGAGALPLQLVDGLAEDEVLVLELLGGAGPAALLGNAADVADVQPVDVTFIFFVE